MNAQIRYNRILKMVYQLPQPEFDRLLQTLQASQKIPQPPTASGQGKLTPMQELLLEAPTWSDEEYNNYLEARKHFNHWRV